MKEAHFSVLLVPSGPQRIASSRLRAFQYISPLRRLGITCRILPAMSDFTARMRVASVRMSRSAKLAYYALGLIEKSLRLIPILLLAARYDVVYLQRTTFPPGILTLLRWINPRLVFDFDDAIHLRDPGDRESGLIGRMKERIKRRAVPAVLRASRCAIVEHRLLEAYARQYCRRVERIAGPIDTELFSPRQDVRLPGPIVIGWMGTPSTSAYLPLAAEALARVASRHEIELHLIGSGPVNMPGVNVRVFPWAEEEERDRLRAFDIGIMPMPDNEWTRGKLGLKMLLYMSVGIPAVVSYTPVNAEVIEHGVNGYIVTDDAAWESALDSLVRDAQLRARLGKAGRETTTARFSLERGSEHLAAILADVAAA